MDGANLSVDITPLGHHSTRNPYSPGDIFWCESPNAMAGADLRGNCPTNFQLKRSDLSFFIQGTTDSVVACFSNCGKYEYPTAPSADCTNSTDPRCGAWRQYCCQAGNYNPATGKGGLRQAMLQRLQIVPTATRAGIYQIHRRCAHVVDLSLGLAAQILSAPTRTPRVRSLRLDIAAELLLQMPASETTRCTRCSPSLHVAQRSSDL